MLFTYIINQQMHIFKYAQSHIFNLHLHISVISYDHHQGVLQQEYN